jgi:hypothetical protein
MSDQFDNIKWERSRDLPSSDQRLRHAGDHHGPPARNRTWIAVAIMAMLVAVGVWLFATGVDSPEDDWPHDDSILEGAPFPPGSG